ncbi:MAG TPA: type I glyceraldehyde-3-phosphate dehydrogenase [Bdellovibrionales bacterium]|nr:MAG: type I glyceraldehyde-3-phosphate dehydrogenase [Bdellovibrionales bacterium GWB1_52_6]OFZ03449.1 MAG: type I glyceraldehyde-3-phosphate dehydrogenase [Bdellovibrionales bacterium GWA1_52_35]OFZ41596.1 MAG: type I glyceraldehyde-3-phosphate dehydrogenase [Bdellovibrionales bacterium GWC1_52_8]HAR42665.1 type I glyceraldehyde-3-phosphate dehydrogenase [Bdellovibrionales bacterium]HCM41030.1 type I glyceraldehyde-3-phosphate dehydrogenase [Bdellovibrionales bacterium]
MSPRTRVAINGFGRIGRVITRLALQRDDIEIVGINDLCRPEQIIHLLKYDSVHGTLREGVQLEGDTILLGSRKIRLTAERDPSRLPWSSLGAELVHECTGVFTEKEKCALHLQSGAKRVIISAPSKDADLTVCMGVNEQTYDPVRHSIISNSSCTTNCLAPVCKVLDEHFGIIRGAMLTIHSYTNDQNVLDFPHKDLRRSRAAALSMIPTTTGATKAVGLVLPQLQGKITGTSVRVPTPNVSILDFTCELARSTDKEALNRVFESAATGAFQGILGYSTEPLVSVDFNGSLFSATLDAEQTSVIHGNFVKVLAWYDNETGFSARMLDLTAFMARKGL